MKQFILLLCLYTVFQPITASSSTTKDGYVCKAFVRANGVFIENCVNWWEGDVWSSAIKNGLGGKHFIIFATPSEYQGLLQMEKKVKAVWDEKQKQLQIEKDRIYNEAIILIKQLKERPIVYENVQNVVHYDV